MCVRVCAGYIRCARVHAGQRGAGAMCSCHTRSLGRLTSTSGGRGVIAHTHTHAHTYTHTYAHTVTCMLQVCLMHAPCVPMCETEHDFSHVYELSVCVCVSCRSLSPVSIAHTESNTCYNSSYVVVPPVCVCVVDPSQWITQSNRRSHTQQVTVTQV